MNKFKVGDRVKRVDPSETLKVGEVYTVEFVADCGIVKVSGYSQIFDVSCFELVSDNETIRKQITDAINTLAFYDIWRNKDGHVNHSSSYKRVQLEDFLDEYYPLKTPQQLEIESIRKEQEKLAARLKELEV